MGAEVIDLTELLLVLGVALITATLFVAVPFLGRRPAPAASPPREESIALLFNKGYLHHATPEAQERFGLVPGYHGWNDLFDALTESFPDMPSEPGKGHRGRLRLRGTEEVLRLNWQDENCWVALAERGQDPEPSGGAGSELRSLRLAEEANPHPAWQLDSTGKPIWENRACRRLRASLNMAPDTPLFDAVTLTDAPTKARLEDPVTGEGSQYQITTRDSGNLRHFSATNIEAQMRAEKARRSFMQTLAKTFAHLPTGLAIFDREGQLALFNPALVDLTQLPAPFLSSRPRLTTFFDQLRENRRMPEPKNYASWRGAIEELQRQAAREGYEETWSLEDGRTYRVRGRPHPDGATAFLFDDITAEIMVTRSFRRELEIGQNLLDLIEDAIVVFSRSGVLTFCNEVYRTMWGQNPEAAFADVTVRDCIAVWRTRGPQDFDWQEVESFAKSLEDPAPRFYPAHQGQSHTIELRCIAPGARMVRFRPLSQAPVPRGDALSLAGK